MAFLASGPPPLPAPITPPAVQGPAFYSLVVSDQAGKTFAAIFTEHRTFQIYLRPRAHAAKFKTCTTLREAMEFMEQNDATNLHWAFVDGVLEDFSHDVLFGNWVSTRWRNMYEHHGDRNSYFSD